MNPVVLLTRNCLKYTKACVASLLAQDIPVDLFIWDNGSTDGTKEWLSELEIPSHIFIQSENLGVSRPWNEMLEKVFSDKALDDPAEHCLVVNNDTVFPKSFYRGLLQYDAPFVTGNSTGDAADIERIDNDPESVIGNRPTLVPHPDFSAYMITKDAWQTIGPFDERMVIYASDLDYHIRAHRRGIMLMNSAIPFYHERSSTLNNADPRERRMIELRADADREVLRQKWNCTAWGEDYKAQFSPEAFGIDRRMTMI